MARVALVTGAAGGIGSAIVDAFLADGATVLAVDVASMPPRPGPIAQFRADLADEANVEAAVRAALGRWGRLDCLVHAAGRVGRGPITATSLGEWREIIDANLTSAFLLARTAHPVLRASRGSLVLLSSPNGVHGGTTLSGPAYAVAKAGLLNLARYLATEWAADHIRVNCVVPGTVDTPMLRRLEAGELEALRASIPLGRFARPEEVAAAVLHLCSDRAEWSTGTALNISGGRLLQ